ncbi:MAG: 4-alpha-glucanotransferase, partial [Opitutae bacterium]
SQLVIITAQDLLSLGSEARFNRPGELQGNWNWRMTAEQFHHLRNHSTHYLREQAMLADRFQEDLNSNDNEKS